MSFIKAVLGIMFLTLSVTAMAGKLTTKDVKLFLKTSPELNAWFDANKQTLDMDSVLKDGGNFQDIATKAVVHIKSKGLFDELSAKVKQAGYSSVEEWARKSTDITMAYAALQMKSSKGMSEKQMKAQLKQMESMQKAINMPEEQKAKMVAQMRESMKSALSLMKVVKKVPQANIDAIKPFKAQIEALEKN